MKHPKSTSSVQEAPIATAPYPDCPSSMQAYHGAAPPAFYTSTVTFPTAHLYMWGSQHHFMPPFGIPMSYPALFPPGGIFTHPTVPMNLAPTNGDTKEVSDGKERPSTKKPKGGVANDGPTLSSESGDDGSSDASKENTSDNESASGKKRNIHQMLADGSSARDSKATTPGNPVVSVPASNLNTGMDYWKSSPARTGSAIVRSNPVDAVAPGATVHDGMMPDQWVHDERELKRQKRKQCNRESARRSRQRKQAECEKLQERVDTLNNVNHLLKEELQRLSEECEKVTSENQSIKDQLLRNCGPDDLARLEIDLQEAGGNSGL